MNSNKTLDELKTYDGAKQVTENFLNPDGGSEPVTGVVLDKNQGDTIFYIPKDTYDVSFVVSVQNDKNHVIKVTRRSKQ